MEQFKLNNEQKLQTGFTVPENYFEDFSANMMQQIARNESKTISIFTKKKIGMFAAAAILIFALSIPIYNQYSGHSSEINDATLENYLADQSNVTNNDLVNLLEEQDIQKMSIDLDIEVLTIENELVQNKNLEQYLLN
jgi:hypothetical protein